MNIPYRYLLIIVTSICVISGCFPPTYLTKRILVDSTLPVDQQWHIELPSAIILRPILTEDSVIVVTSRELIALDIFSGQQIWKYSVGSNTSRFPIVINNDLLLYGDRQGYVTALNRHSGKEKWKHKVGGAYGRFMLDIVIHNQIAFLLTIPTFIEARDLETGELKWDVKGINIGVDTRGSHLRLYNNHLYLSTDETKIMDPETGQVL